MFLCCMGLQGSAPSAIPVGAEAYSTTSTLQPSHRTNGHADSSSPTDGEAACNGSMTGESGTSTAVPDAPAAASLGRAVDAAGCEPAMLEGVGALLPAWREVARLIAPMCHQVRSGFLWHRVR